MTYKIGWDAGHGLNTIGKQTPDREKEWSFNDVIGKAFANELKNYEGVSTHRYDDPTGKTDISLQTRTDKANKDKIDLYISWHHNGHLGKWGDHTGTEVHVYKTKPKEAVKLAQKVAPVLAKAYGLKDRGIKYTDLHITRETHMTSILIEGGFMDSRIDIKKLRNNAVLNSSGKLIAQEVAEFVGLKRKKVAEKPKPVVKPVTKPVTPKPTPKPIVKPIPKPVEPKPVETKKDVFRVTANGKQTGAFSDINNAMSQAKKDLSAGKDVVIKKN